MNGCVSHLQSVVGSISQAVNQSVGVFPKAKGREAGRARKGRNTCGLLRAVCHPSNPPPLRILLPSALVWWITRSGGQGCVGENGMGERGNGRVISSPKQRMQECLFRWWVDGRGREKSGIGGVDR